ncbi:MAG: hypothetical protein R3F07_20390 [Opitutaceae bacterium]
MLDASGLEVFDFEPGCLSSCPMRPLQNDLFALEKGLVVIDTRRLKRDPDAVRGLFAET